MLGQTNKRDGGGKSAETAESVETVETVETKETVATVLTVANCYYERGCGIVKVKLITLFFSVSSE